MIKIAELKKDIFVLKGIFDKTSLPKTINKKENSITEFADKNEAFIYLGKEKDFNADKLETTIEAALAYTRDIQVDVKSFVTETTDEKTVVRLFVEKYEYKFAQLYSIKTSKKTENINVTLIGTTKASADAFKKAQVLAEARN